MSGEYYCYMMIYIILLYLILLPDEDAGDVAAFHMCARSCAVATRLSREPSALRSKGAAAGDRILPRPCVGTARGLRPGLPRPTPASRFGASRFRDRQEMRKRFLAPLIAAAAAFDGSLRDSAIALVQASKRACSLASARSLFPEPGRFWPPPAPLGACGC